MFQTIIYLDFNKNKTIFSCITHSSFLIPHCAKRQSNICLTCKVVGAVFAERSDCKKCDNDFIRL